MNSKVTGIILRALLVLVREKIDEYLKAPKPLMEVESEIVAELEYQNKLMESRIRPINSQEEFNK